MKEKKLDDLQKNKKLLSELIKLREKIPISSRELYSYPINWNELKKVL